jgi:class 3 adenylate cyclase/tetratricopeptide (TPR) repeat protein
VAGLLRDRYEPLEVVGRNAMGAVMVRGLDHRHGRPVGLKVWPVDPEARDAVLAEARVLLQVDPHPGIPVVRDDFYTTDPALAGIVDAAGGAGEVDRYVIVMDWIDGTDLATVLTTRGDPGLPASVVLERIAQAAAALDHLHRHDPPVVHGDVQPSKLVVDGGGRVVLVGFGAPGSASAVPTDDVRALAATTAALLTGAPPAGAPDWTAMAPSDRKWCERVLARALDPDPARRPATAGELVERLRIARGGDLPVGAVTFVLTDIVGSTDLWEAHPSVMTGVIARHHALVADTMEEHGGRLPRSQGEGDSTLSAFARASDAVTAAIALQRALAAEPWPEGIALRVRIGVHTGEAQLEKGDYFGPAVSRTARIRALAGGGQVLLSQATAQLAADGIGATVELVEVGEFELKGLSRAERVHAVVGQGLAAFGPTAGAAESPRSAPLAPPAALAPARQVPFVGRGAELARLTDEWSRARAGELRAALVGGEPGIGKTRLVAEVARVAHEDGASVLYGRCEEELGVPYQPFVEALRADVEHGGGGRLRARLGPHAGELSRLLPDLASRVPGLASPAPADAETERYRLFEAVCAWLTHASAEHPIVLVLDDLHWAAQPTVLMLRHLLRSSGSARLLVLGTFRESEVGRDHPLGQLLGETRAETALVRVALQGLDAREVAAFVRAVEDDGRAASLAEPLLRKTDGNPFFLGEVLRDATEVARAPLSGLDARAIDSFGVPETVKDVIRRRLSRLDEPTVDVLTAAAVVGREFELGTLEAVVEEDDVLDAVDEAVAGRLLTEDPDVVGRFAFAHALVADVLAESIGRTRRARMHRRVADALGARCGRSIDESAGEITGHLMAAGDLERVPELAMTAGRHALRALAYEEAARYFELALTTMDRLGSIERPRRSEVLLALGDARFRLPDREGSMKRFAEAATAARAEGDPEHLADAALGFARSVDYGLPNDEIVALLDEAIVTLAVEDSDRRARLLVMRAAMAIAERTDRRDDLADEAVAIARRVDDPRGLAFVLGAAVLATWGPDTLDRRRLAIDEALAAAERVGDSEVATEARGWRVTTAIEAAASADLEVIRADLDAMAREADRLREGFYRANHLLRAAMVEQLQGRLDTAEVLADESARIVTDQPGLLAGYGALLYAVRREQGRLGELAPVVELFVAETPDVPAWRIVLAQTRLALGDVDAARGELARAWGGSFGALPHDFLWLSTMVLAADVGCRLEDRALLTEVRERLAPYAGRGVPAATGFAYLGTTSYALGLTAGALGDHDDAAAHFEASLALDENLGAAPWSARARERLAELRGERGGAR